MVIQVLAQRDVVSFVCTGTLPPAWGSRNPLVWLLWILTRQGLTLCTFNFIKPLSCPFGLTLLAACQT
jgi:hypothetical protein